MNLDDQLAAFLAETPKQGRAEVFSVEVMKRIERQMFLDRLVGVAMVAFVIGLVLWGCSPLLNLAVFSIAPALAPVAALLAFSAAVLVAGGPAVWRGLGLRVG